MIESAFIGVHLWTRNREASFVKRVSLFVAFR